MAVTNHVLTTEHLKQIVKHNNDTFATQASLDEVKKSIPAVDEALSSTSTNPVQNKAIYTELGKKFDARSEANDGDLAWFDKSYLGELGMTAPKLAVQSISDPTSMTFIGTSDISVLKGSDDGVTSMHTLAFTESDDEDGYDANVPAKITSMDAEGTSVVKKLASTDYVDAKVTAIKPGVTEVKAGATADIISVTTDGKATSITINDVAHAVAADNAAKVNGLTVETAVPANAKFTDTVYEHPDSGVTAGTYKSVTVDAQGHVTAGTNPTTLAGYGITDAKIEKGVITLGAETITPLTEHQSLENYYNKTEVDSKISAIPKFAIAVVTDLPTEDISSTTIYLKKTGDESQNLYTEYIYVNGAWEELGTQSLDLSGYLKSADAESTYLKKTETAAAATKATQDGDGNVISSTYVKSADLVEATEDEVTAILNGTTT